MRTAILLSCSATALATCAGRLFMVEAIIGFLIDPGEGKCHINLSTCEVGPPIAMSMLVRAAKRRETLTYADIAHRLGEALGAAVSPRHIGHVAGTLMDRIIEVDPNAPPINVLIISSTKKLPGHGADWYVKRFLPRVTYGQLTDDQKRAMLRPVHDAIFDFQDWDRVARKAFDGWVPNQDEATDNGESDGKGRRLGFGGPAESDEHRRLKEYVARNPKRFAAPKGCKHGEMEKRLETCDEIDVWFMNPTEEQAIEVKSIRSSDLDLQRGLFQCVKYRALLEARSCIAKSASKVRTRLVTERRLNSNLGSWARLLGIETQTIKPLT
jgi:hypothetical protein